MNLFEHSSEVWAQMSPGERVLFLDKLKTVVVSAAGWLQVSAEDWAEIDFNRLPSDLRGRLMMSVTSTGFSVERYRVCYEVLKDHIRKEQLKNGGAGK